MRSISTTATPAMTWACPTCGRSFRRANQRHTCGTGTEDTLLQNRPAALVATYRAIERFARSLGGVELVTRNRYALFRTSRIFADLTVMRDAVRLVIHLKRRHQDARFVKVVEGRDGKVSHVVKLTLPAEVEDFLPLFAEAHELTLTEDRGGNQG